MCDKVVFLIGGQLAYYGPPADLKRYFKVSAIGDVLDVVKKEAKKPGEWKALFQQSPLFGRFAMEPPSRSAQRQNPSAAPTRPVWNWRTPWRQFPVLTRRAVQLLLTDSTSLAVMLLLPLVIAIFVGIAKSEPPNFQAIKGNMKNESKFATIEVKDAIATEKGRQQMLMGITAISAFFLGLFGSIREVVKELDIYRHERFNGLQIAPYLGSKVFALGGVGIIQATSLLLLIRWRTSLLLFDDNVYASLAQAAVLLFVTILSAQMLGLAISAFVATENMAIVLMVILIIPQLLFSRFTTPQGLTEPALTTARWSICNYWALEGLITLTWAPARLPGGGGETFARSLIVLASFACLYATLTAAILKGRDSQSGFLTRRATRIRRALINRLSEGAST
jgi:hypothetical protein